MKFTPSSELAFKFNFATKEELADLDFLTLTAQGSTGCSVSCASSPPSSGAPVVGSSDPIGSVAADTSTSGSLGVASAFFGRICPSIHMR